MEVSDSTETAAVAITADQASVDWSTADRAAKSNAKHQTAMLIMVKLIRQIYIK